MLTLPPCAVNCCHAACWGHQSADYDPHHPGTVRRDGSFIYEEFLTTGGTDVKVYTVGPRCAQRSQNCIVPCCMCRRTVYYAAASSTTHSVHPLHPCFKVHQFSKAAYTACIHATASMDSILICTAGVFSFAIVAVWLCACVLTDDFQKHTIDFSKLVIYSNH
jgi:hypothetical protein